MNPTEAKFNEDLDRIATQLDLGVRHGRFTWNDVQKRITTQSSVLASATDQYLHRYTWTSLGVVAGLGILIGFLLGRR